MPGMMNNCRRNVAIQHTCGCFIDMQKWSQSSSRKGSSVTWLFIRNVAQEINVSREEEIITAVRLDRLHGIFANTSLLPNLIVNNIKVIIIKCEKKKKGETDVENSSISLLQWLTILESLCLILSSSI